MINVIARGGQRIQIKRLFWNEDYMKDAHGSHGECTIYDLNRTSDLVHKVIEYYPIRIIISNAVQLNFKLVSHRFACVREGNNSAVEILCLCKYNIEILHALCN